MPTLNDAKKPTTNDNYIGVEIEFFAPCSTIDDLGFNSHRLAKMIQIGGDGSIRPDNGHTGFELKLLTKEKNFTADITDIITQLDNIKAKVNNSCGLHLHFDMRQRNVRKAYYNLIDANEFIGKTIPVDRQSSQYCRSTMKESFYDQIQQGHHMGINASAYNEHKTIEIRYHEATLDANEIDTYANFILSVIDSDIYAMPDKFTLSDIDKFSDVLGLSGKTRTWLASRITSVTRPKKNIEARIKDDETEIQKELELVA